MNLITLNGGVEWNPNAKRVHFLYEFFDVEYEVTVTMYAYRTFEECELAKSKGQFDSFSDAKTKHLVLNIGSVRGILYPLACDDIIEHEIQHIYKSVHGGDIKSSNKIVRGSSIFNNDYYNRVCNIMSNTLYSKDIRNVAYAIYCSFEFELNGFLGGLDGVYSTCRNSLDIDTYELRKAYEKEREYALTHSLCYKAFTNIIYVLNKLDTMDDDELYMVFGKRKYFLRKILETSRKQYSRGIGRVLIKYSNLWGNDYGLRCKIQESSFMGRLWPLSWLL